MTNKHGDFIWYELVTSDAAAAQDFYGPLLGWEFTESSKSDEDYPHISMDGEAIGGILPLTKEMAANGALPCWLGYIETEDVDRMAEAILSAGGSVHLQPQDVKGVGRFALVTDQQGAMFYVMKSAPPADNSDAHSTAFAETVPMAGHCAWNELATTDPDAALNFYHDLFGWEKEADMDMGPLGTYTVLRHDFMIGAIMAKPDELPASAWTYYFRVPDIDSAIQTIKAKRGQTLTEPMEIPGGDFTLTAVDPQGATFALIGARHST